ncbi:MAG: FAD-dependent oxidoreductase [Deltaproteobacteria bacterium]|nr:FAD-dependent oxidoreductase [Deltaproteobacteria bacterium]
MERTGSVAVVGGGIGGLAAAAFAARAGARVTLFERMAEPGGRARTRDEQGFLFNMGPHALYRGGPAEAALRELGIELSGASAPTSGALAIRGGRLHALPGGFVSLLSTGLLRLPEKLELARLLGAVPRIDTASLDGVTLAEYLHGELRHAGTRQVVEAVVRLTGYANAPELLSAGAAISQLALGTGAGVRYLDGGWQSLVDALERRARGAGVELRCGARVEGVEHDGRVRALRLGDGERVDFDAVILALGPAEASAVVDDGSNPLLCAAERACVPVRAACLDLGLERLPEPSRSFALGIDAPTYFSVHSSSARLAPDGRALIQAARYLAPGESPAREELEAGFDAMLDLVQPGWRKLARVRRVMRELVVVHDLPQASRGGLAGRTPVAVGGIANLFLAGDWVGPSGMLADASFASAREAASLAVAARGLGVAA